MSHSSRLLTAAAVAAAALTVLILVAVHTAAGQRADEHLFGLAQTWPVLGAWPSDLLKPVIPPALALACCALAALRLSRRELRPVVTAGATVVLTMVVTQSFERFLARPDLGVSGYPYNTLPSSHVSLDASLAVAAFLLWPRRGRTWAGRALAVVVLAACVSSVHGFAHRPSDVVASALVATACACLVLWVAGAASRQGSARQPSARAVSARSASAESTPSASE